MSKNECIKRLQACMDYCAKRELFADLDGNVAEVKRWNDEFQRCAVEHRELTR